MGQVSGRRGVDRGLGGCWAEPHQAEMQRKDKDSEAGAAWGLLQGPVTPHCPLADKLHLACHSTVRQRWPLLLGASGLVSTPPVSHEAPWVQPLVLYSSFHLPEGLPWTEGP